MRKSKSETAKLFLRILREQMQKVHDEVLSLALCLSLILAAFAVISGQFDYWIGQFFINIFLVATVYFILLRLMEMILSKEFRKNRKGVKRKKY